jgi:hypothetical protein
LDQESVRRIFAKTLFATEAAAQKKPKRSRRVTEVLFFSDIPALQRAGDR